ncbi:MAG: GAP family protein [Solirubrobacteraceae bacterium]
MSTVLLFSVTAMANPTLVAVTTVMLILPSPRRLMIGYLIGAYMMSVPIGLVIVLVVGQSGLVRSGKNTINPGLDFAFGIVLLIIAFILHSGRDRPVRERRAERKSAKPKKTPRWQQVLSKGDPRLAILIGALLTLPGASYLAAMTSLAKLNYSTVTDVLVVLMVNVIMLALLEVPLICFIVAPDWTPMMITRVKGTVNRDGRKILTIGCTAVGSLVILRGLITVFS